MRNYLIFSGANGWADEALGKGFYPEDLPVEWQLPFYNTQFRCVYLPFPVWHNAPDELVALWLKECSKDFCFVLGAPTAGELQEDARLCRFGERARLESQVDLLWLTPQASNLRELASRIMRAVQNQQPLFLLARWEDLALLRQTNELMMVLGV